MGIREVKVKAANFRLATHAVARETRKSLLRAVICLFVVDSHAVAAVHLFENARRVQDCLGFRIPFLCVIAVLCAFSGSNVQSSRVPYWPGNDILCLDSRLDNVCLLSEPGRSWLIVAVRLSHLLRRHSLGLA